jgi:hypothetical protein
MSIILIDTPLVLVLAFIPAPPPRVIFIKRARGMGIENVPLAFILSLIPTVMVEFNSSVPR